MPETRDRPLPRRRAFLRQAGRGLRKRSRCNLLHQREETGKLRQEEEKIQFISQRTVARHFRRVRESFLYVRVQASLKGCDARIETQPFGSEGIRGRKFGGAPDAAIPLRLDHRLARDLATISSYHFRWNAQPQAPFTYPAVMHP